jgi:hypothetical protein
LTTAGGSYTRAAMFSEIGKQTEMFAIVELRAH